jgi:fluoroacetyl-CoA thioesterase
VKPTLLTGLTGSANHEVTKKWSTDHAFHPVLATPSMIGLIEWVCFEVTEDHLDEGEVTVGIHVCVSHESSVLVGEHIGIAAELVEIDGRKLTFDVVVTGPRGRVSQGTHKRAILSPPPG